MMQKGGFPRFNMRDHTLLWQSMNANEPTKGYGVTLSDGRWYWYPRWVEEVRRHCEANRDKYA